jgi:hypothetical protein
VLASRAAWRQTALRTGACIVEIEVICSEPALHRQRVENRLPDIDGHKVPTWDDVVSRTYEPWDREHLVLDTAESSLDHVLDRVEAHVREKIG